MNEQLLPLTTFNYDFERKGFANKILTVHRKSIAADFSTRFPIFEHFLKVKLVGKIVPY